MIAEKMKKRVLVEFKERHLDEWPSINCPVELAERLEEFKDVSRTLKQKTHTLTPVRRPEIRGSNQAEHFRKFDNRNTKRTANFNPERRYLDTPPTMKEIKREQPNSQVESCSVTPQKGLHLKKNITLGNEIVSALIDTGSTVSLIREDVSSKIVDRSRLSKINTALYGLGQTEVITKGSFEYDFVLDKDQYSLTGHVVPTKQLNFEAIIGTDILGQASLNFTQVGVMFHKHEEMSNANIRSTSL
ncbi:transposon Tf2-9 polyprotein [Trichonephila clavipes]|uniref:Transposon Tf2-9 polyprotein n=1 Tax=Trichonephila clavipes TaxID=2585209 RepID=A0A8X6UYR7_TRICX|nr:transposon Tf2-9 polyprotein [Trichonephila clavipes]